MIGVDRSEFGDDFPGDGLFIQSDISRAEDMQSIFDKAHGFTESLEALVHGRQRDPGQVIENLKEDLVRGRVAVGRRQKAVH